MKIVVLDSLPLNPGDLDWAPLRALGDLTLHENTAPAEVVERVREAEVVYTNKVPVRADALTAAPRLKLISVLATGTDNVDVAAARERGIKVCNVPAYSTPSTAQTTMALLLELAHHAGAHDTAVRSGAWQRAGRFSFWNYPLLELDGLTMLIVGLGAIGRRVARIAGALGMNVLAAQLPGREKHVDARHGVGRMPLDEALPLADVVSLHCPLTPQTRGLINAARISRMKPGALLVNTARGLLIDENFVAAALRAGQLGGYAADVLSSEPPAPDNPLLHAPHCILTPHLSWATPASRQRLLDASVANLRAFLNGTPQNVI